MSYSYKRRDGRFRGFGPDQVETATFSRQANGPEVLRLRFIQEPAEADRFLAGEVVQFWADNGTGARIFFTGECMEPAHGREPDADSREYTFLGPWAVHFENRQLFGLWKDKQTQEMVPLPRTYTHLEGERPLLGDWMRSLCDGVLTAARRQGSVPFRYALNSGVEFDVPFSMPVEALGPMTYANAVLRALRWIPDAAIFFDHYNNEVPVLHFGRSMDREAYEVKIGHEYRTGMWRSVSAQKTRSFAARGIVITWVISYEVEGQEPGLRYVVEKYPRGVEIGDFGVIALDAHVREGDTDAPGDGLAEMLFRAGQQFVWQGEAEFAGIAPTLSLNPGARINVTGTGAKPDWATMHGFLDNIEHDLKAGTTRITWGAPSSLGLDDLREILRWWREREIVPESAITSQTEGEQTYGFAQSGGKFPGYSPKVFQIVVNGALTSVKIPVKTT